MKTASHENVIGIRAVDFDCKYTKKDGRVEVPPQQLELCFTGPHPQDKVMIVMELARGGEFFDFLMNTGALPESVARAYFRQLVSW